MRKADPTQTTVPNQIISPHLLRELEHRYVVSINSIHADTQRVKLNATAKHGLSVFTIAVAAWEAFINEKCLSKFTRSLFPSSGIWKIENRVDKWSLEEKTLLLPAILFGKSFAKDEHPYQDFAELVKVRNFITHFRVDKQELSVFKSLEQRNIIMPASPAENYIIPAAVRLETTEAIRWAHNAVAKMAVYFLEKIAPDVQFPFAVNENGVNININLQDGGKGKEASPLYYEISDSQVSAWFTQLGLDPQASTNIDYKPNTSGNSQILLKIPLR